MALAQPGSRPGDEVDVLHVQGNVYMIAGDGGNIAVQSGPEGVVVVDSGSGESSEAVVAAIRRISSEPIRYLINTSAHIDHAGGNTAIAMEGVSLGDGAFFGGPSDSRATIVAQENVLITMTTADVPETAWPHESFIDRKNIYLNGEAIQLIHQPAAHSNGDTVVHFRGSDVVVTGAVFDMTRFPIIGEGGSIQGLIDALNDQILTVVPSIPLVWQDGGTKIVPGRGHIAEQAELVEYRDMVTIVRDVVQSMIDEGMTLEEVIRAEPVAGYAARYGSESGDWTTDMFVEAVYASLTEAP